MTVLKNARHERFAQEIVKGKSADEAYVLAGYKRNDGNAARMNGNESIIDSPVSQIDNVLPARAARGEVAEITD